MAQLSSIITGLGYAAAVYGTVLIARTIISIASAALGAATKPSLRSYGRWAVVTGATDGIGKAYAKQLLKAGLDVILVSRTQARLDATAEELRAKFPARVVSTIAFDFTATVESGAYATLKAKVAALAGADLGVVINNVGVSYPGALYYGELETYAPGLSREIVHVNVDSVFQLSTIALDLFAAKPAGRRGAPRGAIINISSASGRVPIGEPLCAAYRSVLGAGCGGTGGDRHASTLRVQRHQGVRGVLLALARTRVRVARHRRAVPGALLRDDQDGQDQAREPHGAVARLVGERCGGCHPARSRVRRALHPALLSGACLHRRGVR